MFWNVFTVWLKRTESQFYFSSLWQCLTEIQEEDLVSHMWSWKRGRVCVDTLLWYSAPWEVVASLGLIACEAGVAVSLLAVCLSQLPALHFCHPCMILSSCFDHLEKMQVSSANWVFFKFPKVAFYVLSLERSWTVFPRSLILPESASWMPGHHKCCLSVVSLMWQMHWIHFQENVCRILRYGQPSLSAVVLSEAAGLWRVALGWQLSQKSCGPAGVLVCPAGFIT